MARTDYGRLCSLFYDADKPAPPKAEWEFYLDFLGSPSQAGAILEPMCGSGRFLIPLLSAGYDIHGFDRSAPMLETCRQRIARLGGDTARVQCCGFDGFHAPHPFAGCLIPAGSFSLIHEQAKAGQALAILRSLLLPAGQLGLEICAFPGIPPASSRSEKEVEASPGVTIHILSESFWKPEEGIEEIVCVYEERLKGEPVAKENERYRLKRWTPSVFEGVLKENGWRVRRRIDHPFEDSRCAFWATPIP